MIVAGGDGRSVVRRGDREGHVLADERRGVVDRLGDADIGRDRDLRLHRTRPSPTCPIGVTDVTDAVFTR